VIPLYFKLGILDRFFSNGEKKKSVDAKLDLLDTNHLHSISESLKRIEERLGEIHDNILIVKTRVNGK